MLPEGTGYGEAPQVLIHAVAPLPVVLVVLVLLVVVLPEVGVLPLVTVPLVAVPLVFAVLDLEPLPVWFDPETLLLWLPLGPVEVCPGPIGLPVPLQAEAMTATGRSAKKKRCRCVADLLLALIGVVLALRDAWVTLVERSRRPAHGREERCPEPGDEECAVSPMAGNTGAEPLTYR
jgi:hypothetical protein